MLKTKSGNLIFGILSLSFKVVRFICHLKLFMRRFMYRLTFVPVSFDLFIFETLNVKKTKQEQTWNEIRFNFGAFVVSLSRRVRSMFCFIVRFMFVSCSFHFCFMFKCVWKQFQPSDFSISVLENVFRRLAFGTIYKCFRKCCKKTNLPTFL